MPYRFELATAADDADLRHILAATPMAGRVSVAFRREPSFFAASGVEGRVRQVVAARDTEAGKLVGFGCRSVRTLHVNGEPCDIGYLSALRLLPEHRNRGLVARGYAFFRNLHRDGLAPLYLTTIADGNEVALRLLTSGRAGLPTYHFAGEYHTCAIAGSAVAGGIGKREDGEGYFDPEGSKTRPRAWGDVQVRRATVNDLPRLVEFLNREGSRRQFFPRLMSNDFVEGGLFHGLKPEAIFLAIRDNAIVGTLAAWDQSAFRQTTVHAYQGALRWLRPAYNVLAHWRRRPVLPAAGEAFGYVTGALPVIENDDTGIFSHLIGAVCRTHPDRHLLIGLHIEDPLLPTVRRLAAACYLTRLYLVCWEDGEALRESLDGRVPYLELGTL
jgi:hypothetical protein